MHLDRVLADVHDAGLDALLVSTPANTYYVSGFRAITYSRPVLVVAGDSPLLLIPELEATHARATSVIPAIRTYADTGLGGLRGKSTLQVAIDHCVDAMRECGLRGRRIGFEPGGFSVDGYAYLSEAWGEPFVPVRGLVEARRMVKDDHELELIRIGAALADVGMRVEVDASVPRTTEIEIMAHGDAAMLLEAARRHPDYHVTAGSRPVSGEKSVRIPIETETFEKRGESSTGQDAPPTGITPRMNALFSSDRQPITSDRSLRSCGGRSRRPSIRSGPV